MDSAETGNGPGAQLQAARLSLGIEIREISDALNLPASTIEAIERDEFDGFQAVVFARGYVRGYAKLVELDPAAVLASFPGVVDSAIETAAAPGAMSGGFPQVDAGSESGSEILRRLRRLVEELYRDNPVPLLAAAGIGLLLLLALFIWALSGGSDPELELRPIEGAQGAAADPRGLNTPSGAVIAAASASPAPAGSPFASIAGADAAVAAGADWGAAPDTAAPTRRGADSTAQPTQTTDQLPASATALSTGAASAGRSDRVGDSARGSRREVVNEQLNAGNEELVLSFSADCWVDIKSSAGRDLYSNLGRAATELRLRGSGPFRILLGYAPGVSLAFNGDDVSLAPHTRNNVARLVLGQ